MDIEPEAVRDLLSSLTKAPFEISSPKSGDPLSGQELKWFILCPDIVYSEQTAHIEAAWAEVEDIIWLESSLLGFATDWVEEDYREKGIAKFLRMKSVDFVNSQFRRKFGKEFPLVMKKLETYEKIASYISSVRDVNIEIRYDSSEGETSFTLGAKIEAKGMDLQSKLKAIEKNVAALKEAYEKIEDLQQAQSQ